MDKEKDFKQLQHTYNVFIYEDTLSEFDIMEIMKAYCKSIMKM